MVACVICQWSESHSSTSSPSFTTQELYKHFKTERHVKNWIHWCQYCREQQLTDDYVVDWLSQNKLLTIHKSAIADAGVSM